MEHIKEFDKNAPTYGKYSVIQKEVAKELIAIITSKPQKVIDLGCGSGTIYNLIDWSLKEFIALDKSAKMLQLHPGNNVQKVHCGVEDFDFDAYSDYFFISASALQWCSDLNSIFQKLNNKSFVLAIFTANTFKSLHKVAQTTSPILSKESILTAVQKNLAPNVETELKNYSLKFDSTLQMLQYIKKSGVSGGEKMLNYKQTKNLLQNYDKNYLEFEVVFVSSK